MTLLDPTRRGALKMRDNESTMADTLISNGRLSSQVSRLCRPVTSPTRYGLLSRSHRSFQIDPQPLWLPPLLSPPSTLSPETLINPRKTKIPKKERERTHERLLEHKWLLDQEHERRFRRGMAAIMADVLEFQMASA